jgi:DNA-binding NarL/FixJ family response regulator
MFDGGFVTPYGVHPIEGAGQSTDTYPNMAKTLARITVLLADDNRIVREGFRDILKRTDDLEVVGEAKNGLEAVALVKKLRPDLVLMDVTMPLLSGLKATGQILQACPATKVLMLSAHSDEAYIVEAMHVGAMGYLVKQTSAESVCEAIREVQKGHTFFSPSIPRRLHKRPWIMPVRLTPARKSRAR